MFIASDITVKSLNSYYFYLVDNQTVDDARGLIYSNA